MKVLPFNPWLAGLFFLAPFVLSQESQEKTAVFVNGGNYKGADDTFLVNAGPFAGGMSNFGKCPTIEVSKNSRYSLIRFDVSSLNAKYSMIKKVTLRLFCQNEPKGGGWSLIGLRQPIRLGGKEAIAGVPSWVVSATRQLGCTWPISEAFPPGPHGQAAPRVPRLQALTTGNRPWPERQALGLWRTPHSTWNFGATSVP